MKTYSYDRYGPVDVLELVEAATPVAGPGQVLVRVRAASVNAYDWRLITATPFLVRTGGLGFFRPKDGKVGADLAGVVESVGDGVTDFKEGDEVFGTVSSTGRGAFAEYALASPRFLAHKPGKVSFEEAAALPMAGTTALQALRNSGGLLSGERVAVNGASGGVGTYAVQIAKILGGRVTAVCSTGKVDLVGSLGADQVVDYTATDFTACAEAYDLVVGVNGFVPIRRYKGVLAPTGRYVMAGGNTKQIFQALLWAKLLSEKQGRRLLVCSAKTNRADMETLAAWMDEGRLRSVIDRSYAFDELPQAIRYVQDGHAAGKVVIRVAA